MAIVVIARTRLRRGIVGEVKGGVVKAAAAVSWWIGHFCEYGDGGWREGGR